MKNDDSRTEDREEASQEQTAQPQQKYNLKVIPVTQLQQNSMVFWSTETRAGILLDPGGEIDKLMAEIEELGVDIQTIWITHGHVDHVGAAAEARRRLDVEIVGPHDADKFLIDSLVAGQYGISEAEPFTPDRWLDDGDTVSLGDLTFDVLHCPGHSPGHVVFYQSQLSFAFVGDVLFQGSIGRTDLPGADNQQLISSITEKLWPLGDVQFVPGHGPASTFANERKTNGFVADHILA